MDLVPVARIVKPRGFRGEVWVDRYREGFPEFPAGSAVWVGTGEAPRRLTVSEFFEYAKGAVLRLDGVDGPGAESLAGAELLLPADQVPEEGPDEFDTEDVVGFAVRDRKRGVLGAVEAVAPGQAYWTFLVKGPSCDAEIPAVEGLGVKRDKAGRVLEVDLPDGYPGVDEAE